MDLADKLTITALDGGNYIGTEVGFISFHKKDKEEIKKSMKPINYRILGLCGVLDMLDEEKILNVNESKKYIDENTADHILSIYPSSLPYVDADKSKAPYVIAKILQMVNGGEKEEDIRDEIGDVKIPFGTDQEYLVYKHIMETSEDTVGDSGAKLLRVIWGDDISSPEGSIIDDRSWIGARLRFTIFLSAYGTVRKKNMWKSVGINTDTDTIKDILDLNGNSKYRKLINCLSKLGEVYFVIVEELKAAYSSNKYNPRYESDVSALLYAITHNYIDFSDEFFPNDECVKNEIELIEHDMADMMFYLARSGNYGKINFQFITNYIKKSKSKYENRPSERYIWEIDEGNTDIYTAIDYNTSTWGKLLENIMENSNPNICGNMAYNYGYLLSTNPAKVIRSLYTSLMSVLNYEIMKESFKSESNTDTELSNKMLSLYEYADSHYRLHQHKLL
jgi:hypothetical protein